MKANKHRFEVFNILRWRCQGSDSDTGGNTGVGAYRYIRNVLSVSSMLIQELLIRPDGVTLMGGDRCDFEFDDLFYESFILRFVYFTIRLF